MISGSKSRVIRWRELFMQYTTTLARTARNNCLGGANNHTGEVLPKGSERATQEHQ